MGTDARLLERIERFCDGVPRSGADPLDLGPFTIFLTRIPWRYCARPRLGVDLAVTAEDVTAVRERQRTEGVPERLEWIAEVTPSLAGAARAAGLLVTRVPLMALDAAAWRPATGARVRSLDADDPDLERVNAVVELAFAQPHRASPAAAPAGPPERDALAGRSGELGFLRERILHGLTVLAAADDVDGPLAAGSHQPLGDVAEVSGIGTLPAARRRGLATAVTSHLVDDARNRGARVVLLSAADDVVARMYRRLGFRAIGTACFARVPGDGP